MPYIGQGARSVRKSTVLLPKFIESAPTKLTSQCKYTDLTMDNIVRVVYYPCSDSTGLAGIKSASCDRILPPPLLRLGSIGWRFRSHVQKSWKTVLSRPDSLHQGTLLDETFDPRRSTIQTWLW